MIKLPSFAKTDYDLEEREVLYQGIFTLARYHITHRVFKGGSSQPFTREILERKSAAAVLPYDPLLDRVILIEQFRAGAIKSNTNPWLLEIVAGVFNHGETPENIVYREAEEEAGCKLLDLSPICEYFVSPGGSNEYLYLFCGRVDASHADGIFGLPEENEDIRAISMSADDAFSLLQQGKIKTSPAIMALLWLQLNREKLKQLWQKK
ncbi:MAG: hypothetical protein A3F14_04530 [Gammaproteobacteria bacterium RIFCSPHIGHO2_12_FULL_43_28]|nr:MAG: hypothetical protein A3F14_04530 [Gammaproteobacteria bacterium RIFCSPHIGHO2_12_FULL_43_28]